MQTTHRMLVVHPFAGFGDTLALTPALHWLAQHGVEVEVCCPNDEPLRNNPDVARLLPYENHPALAAEAYEAKVNTADFDAKISYLFLHNVDYMNLAVLGRMLPRAHKEVILHLLPEEINPSLKELVDALRRHVASRGAARPRLVVVSPTTTWPSRTLPKAHYVQILRTILAHGDLPILVGRTLDGASYGPNATSEDKGIHDLSGAIPMAQVINLVDKTSFRELAWLLSQVDLAITTESGLVWAQGTQNHSWQIFVPSLKHPEFILPYRQGGDPYYRTLVWSGQDVYPPQRMDCPADITAIPPVFPPPESFREIYQEFKALAAGTASGLGG